MAPSGGRDGCVEALPEGGGAAGWAPALLGGGVKARPETVFGAVAGWKDIVSSKVSGTGFTLVVPVPGTVGIRAAGDDKVRAPVAVPSGVDAIGDREKLPGGRPC